MKCESLKRKAPVSLILLTSSTFLRRTFLFSLIALSLQACAAMAPPPGGPEEKIPPAIDTTTPYNRQINVPVDTRIMFRFDRDVDRASFIQAFSITPYLIGIPKYRWSGNDQVTVELSERLRDSTTYTVQLSRDLKSRRNNILPSPIRITFSTGPAIDTGSLSGFLLPPFVGQAVKASNVYIHAYDISIRNRDTLNFTQTPPDLLTQPNDQGIWQFLAMKVGHRYRVMAVGDVYRNHIYDPGVDAFGVPSGDAILDSTIKSNFYIRMSPATDTVSPSLQDVEVIDSFHVRAHFSEAIDSNDVRATNFTLSNASLIAAFRENADKRPGQITLLTSTPLIPSHDYTLSVSRDSVHDLARNPVSDSAYKVTFSAPSVIRGAPGPKIPSIGMTDSTRDVSTTPSIPLTFSDVVDRAAIEHSITLTDTAKRIVPIAFRWYDDAKVYFKPVDSLMSNVFYTMAFQTGNIHSPVTLIPHDVKDTTLHFHFQTTNVREFGRLSGDIVVQDSFFVQTPKGALVVQAINTGTSEVRPIVLKHEEKHFSFDQLASGNYRVRAFFSRDGRAVYDPGSIQPWQFGVPSGDFPKDLEVRPRWDTKQVNFEVK